MASVSKSPGGLGQTIWRAAYAAAEINGIYLKVHTDDFVSTVDALWQLGASGFAIWGGMDYFLRIASLQNPPQRNGLPELQAEFRTVLGAAYPQAAGGAMLAATSTIDWANATSLTLIGTQMNSTLAEALRSSDRVASEFGLAKPPARGTTISQN